MTSGLPLDHLVVAAPELRQGVELIESRLGVHLSPGGNHPQWGSRNVLLHLEGGVFLEVIAPDPALAPEGGIPLFGIDQLTEPRLVTWAAAGSGLPDLVARGAAAGLDLGAVLSGRRRKPDGTEIAWTLTDPLAAREGGVVPFFIDWGETPHPTQGQTPAATVLSVELLHPEPERIRRALQAIGIETAVTRADDPGLRATLETPVGTVVLA